MRPGEPMASGRPLPESLTRFQEFLEAAPDAMLVVDREGRILLLNSQSERLFGYSRRELLGRSVDTLVPRHLREKHGSYRQRYQSAPQVRPMGVGQELFGLRRDGTEFPLEISLSPLTTREGPVVVSAIRDNTEQKRLKEELAHARAEEARRESEERYRALFDLTPLPLLIVDPRTLAILEVNVAAISHYGYSQEELLGLTLGDIQTGPGMAGAPEGEGPNREAAPVVSTQHRKKDGTVIDVLVYTKTLLLGGKPLALCLVSDVTETRHLEDQIRRIQKLEAVGKLASGIAHDFNNLLTPVLGYCDSLASQLPAHAALQQEIGEIRRAGERAAALTRQLLAFSRNQPHSPRTLSLNEVVLELESMLRRVLGEDLGLHCQLAPDLGAIKADRSQMEQVLVNLSVNARDAMPAGGRLTVETRNVELSEEYAREHVGVVPGHHVVLAVSDTGLGMSEGIRSRIFEPFFTTKEAGKGTGLGLSTVYGIVRQNGGHIWVYSEPGRGTTFKVYFPRVDEAPPAEEPSRATEEEAPGASTTILVCEDDDAVRLMTQKTLARLGYGVLTASGGQEALAILDQHPGPVEVLLTDMVMAGMNGPELAVLAARRRPGIKVLYMSGYSEISAGGAGAPYQAALLEKPFTGAVLSRKIRQVLSEPP